MESIFSTCTLCHPSTDSYSAADLVGDGVLAAEGVTDVLPIWSELGVLHRTNPGAGHSSKVTAAREELGTEDVGPMSRVNTLADLENNI